MRGPHAPRPHSRASERGPALGNRRGSRKERRRRKPRGRREEGPRPRITERGAVSQVRRRREPESRLSQVRSRAGRGRGSGILSRPWAVLSPPAAISLPAARVGLEPQHFLYLGGHCSLFKDAASPKPPRLTLRLPSGFRRHPARVPGVARSQLLSVRSSTLRPWQLEGFALKFNQK